MKVFLLKEVPNLGHKGEVVDVSEGYARNFLLRRKLAEIATSQIIARVQAIKAKENETKQEKMKESERVVKLLLGKTFQFEVRVGKNGEVFSSVHQDDVKKKIAEFIREKGGQVLSEEDIQFESKPIKELGIKNIEFRIGKGDWAKKVPVELKIVPEN